jgi:hypothetical protein
MYIFEGNLPFFHLHALLNVYLSLK